MKLLSKKKVLILVNHEIVIYNFRKEFILRLLEEGYKVYISSPKGKKIEELELLGCIHIETKIDRRGVNPVKDFKLLMHYWEIFKNIQPDIIFSYTIKPNIYGGFVSRILKIPFVATVTGLGSSIANKSIIQNIVNLLYKKSLKDAQKIFFQNEENLDYFIKNKIIKVKQEELIAGSGVNLTKFDYREYPEKNGTIKFIYIGRIMKEKGFLEFLAAAQYFKRKLKNIEFHILGFMEDDFKEKVERLTKKDIIIYHGQQSDIRPYIEQSHAIIHPSYHEGLSNVLLEAAATGRPILASDIPGCKETFEEGITGLSFKPKSTDSLIKVINKFIKMTYEKKEEMGILGRKKVEKEFDRKDVVSAYVKELNNLNNKNMEEI